MRSLIVIPTYQEAANVVDVLRRVRAAAPDVDVLVVDDGSPDGTADIADAAGHELGHVTVMRRPGKAGLGSAYRAGFRWGLDRGYEALVEMDADLSHDPAVIPELLANVADGVDLVIGSRYVPGGSIPTWTTWRRGLSRWGNRYAAWALGLDVADATAGFRAYRADALVDIAFETVRADGYGFQIETAYRMLQRGRKIVEIPICFFDRQQGASKMSGRIVAEALLLVTAWGARDRVRRLAHRG
ncbi:MAG TPA: polyprenol monophosphomannose synthase [Acidimicrobiales bacterium]|nr:polyprenol monophosphomannose synthase [Acidimicrobiales bacterium]